MTNSNRTDGKTPYRVDANGNLQIQHPETGAWVPGIVLLQIAGGLISQLNADQFKTISGILSSTQNLAKLNDILNRLEALNQSLSSIQVDEHNTAEVLVGSISANIATFVTLARTIASLVEISNETIEQEFAAISSRIVDYSANFRELQLGNTGISNRIDLLRDTVGVVNTSVGTVRDTLNTVNTSVGTVRDTVNTVNTSIGTVRDTVNTVNTSVGTVRDTVNTVNTTVGAIRDTQLLINTTLTNLSLVVTQRLPNIEALLTTVRDRIANLYASTVMLNVITMTGANVETAITLPANTKVLSFKSRPNATTGNASDLRYAFATGQVTNVAAGLYRTLNAFNEYNENRLLIPSGTLYVAAVDASSLVVEVEAWA
jgi:uncharacterized phage infection (PIP) family protein YhgE